MGLFERGRPGDGYCRGGTVWLQITGHRLPQGVLGAGNAIHDGQGESRIHAQPRRDVQPSD